MVNIFKWYFGWRPNPDRIIQQVANERALARELRTKRGDTNLTRSQLADRINATEAFVKMIEDPLASPTLAQLRHYATGLDINISYVVHSS